MCQFLETIKCKNGRLFHLPFHQARFNLAREHHFPDSTGISLEDIIQIPESCKTGVFKCRIIYGRTIMKTEFIPYEYRAVKSLKLVEDNEIEYRFKYNNREKLNLLFELRGNCDDILIIKNEFVTDSFVANVVLFDGLSWWTPDTPLLPGTQRSRLLQQKKILKCRITPADLSKYQKIGLINAMQDMEEMPVIEINKIDPL